MVKTTSLRSIFLVRVYKQNTKNISYCTGHHYVHLWTNGYYDGIIVHWKDPLNSWIDWANGWPDPDSSKKRIGISIDSDIHNYYDHDAGYALCEDTPEGL